MFIMPHSFITLCWSKYSPCCLKIKHLVSGKMVSVCFAMFVWKYLNALLSVVINNVLVVGMTILLHMDTHTIKNNMSGIEKYYTM